MGVFDFVKDAGAKVGIGESSEEKAQAASEEAAKQAAANAKARNEQLKKRAAAAADIKEKAAATQKAQEAEARKAETERSESMERYLKTMGLGDVDVRIKNGKANIFGKAKNQATRERIILAVGNTQGVDQVNDYLEIPEPEPESEMYVVQKGDTLSQISKEVYGDPMKYPAIFEANKPMLTDPDLIFPGQVLRIPADA